MERKRQATVQVNWQSHRMTWLRQAWGKAAVAYAKRAWRVSWGESGNLRQEEWERRRLTRCKAQSRGILARANMSTAQACDGTAIRLEEGRRRRARGKRQQGCRLWWGNLSGAAGIGAACADCLGRGECSGATTHFIVVCAAAHPRRVR